MINFKKYFVVLFLFPVQLFSQQIKVDSLTLNDVILQVMSNYPALKKIENDLVAMDAKTGLTRSAYLPDVNFSSSYSRVGPTTSITMPINGTNRTFSLFPENVYNATFSFNENLYDFGRTSKNLLLDAQNKEFVTLTAEQTKQKLSLAVTGYYYSIIFLQEAIRIKLSQLNTLNEHLQFIQKKADTGSATKYDIVTTKVKISAIENQLTDLNSSLKIQSAQMNSLLGKPSGSFLVLKNIVIQKQLLPSLDSLLNRAYENRSEMKIARQKELISKSKLEVIKVQNNPSFNFFASGGYKNGYLNSYLQDVGKMNYAVGVGLKVPVFDANRSKYLKIQANSEIQSNQQDTELAKRTITNEVVENVVNTEAALTKVKQTELQVVQAKQAYELADVNFKAGAITNLDLLDSSTTLAESKLFLFKAEIDYLMNLQKLKISVGEKLTE